MADVRSEAEASPIGAKRRKFEAYEQNKEREQKEQQTHRRYYHSKQWTDSEVAALRARGQQATVRNRIQRKVDFLVGIEQRMRRDPKAYPRNPSDEKSADVCTAAMRYACDNARWEKIASDAAHDGLVSGIGVAWVGIERSRDGHEPAIRHGQVDRFFYDPRSVEPDFSDARYMGMHLWLDIDDAKAKWPEKADALQDVMDAAQSVSSMPVDEDRSQQWADFERRRVRVIEYWEKRAAPTITGHAWYYCEFVGDLELSGAWSPYLDDNGIPDCPYEAWSPYVDEKGDRYGVIRAMISVQDSINHRASKMLHRVSSRQTYARRGVLDDVDAARRELTRPDGHVEMTDGQFGVDFGVIDQGQQIQGEAELLQLDMGEIENLGPNPGLIGKGGGVADQSGRAILAQRDSGMTELSPVFDRLRDWKLRVYRKLWSRIRQAWAHEKWIRVTEDGQAPQFIGLNQIGQDPMSGRLYSQNMLGQMDVDIIMEEGPDVITMQDELLQQLSQLGPLAAGPLGRVFIELSGTPKKDMLLQMLDEANQASAPPPNPLEIEGAQAEIDKIRAEAMAKRAAAVKAMADADAVDAQIGNLGDSQPTYQDYLMPAPPMPVQPPPAPAPMQGMPANSFAPQPNEMPGDLPINQVPV